MNTYLRHILFIILLHLAINLKAGYFTPVYTGYPYNPMSILITDIANCSLQTGDEIAVYDGNICVGSKIFCGKFPIDINVSYDDPTTSVKDGFNYGNAISFRIWKKYSSIEYKLITCTYAEGFNTFFVPFGTALVSLNVNTGVYLKNVVNQCFDIDENPNNNSKIGTISALFSGDFYFSLIDNNSKAISLDSVTGDLYVKDSSIFNYETNDTLKFKFRVYSIDDPLFADTANLSIKINNVEEPIIVTTDGDDTAYVGKSYYKSVIFSDPDNNNVNITVGALPAWVSYSVSDEGIVKFSGTPELSDTGSVSVSIYANDGLNEYKTIAFDLTVRNLLTPITVKNNPSSGNFIVGIETDSNSDVKMVVRQLNGIPIKTQNLGNVYGKLEIPVNLTNLPKNYYLLEVQIGQQVITSKLIVQ